MKIKHINLDSTESKKYQKELINILFTKCNYIKAGSTVFEYDQDKITIQVDEKIYTKKIFLEKIGENK